MQTTIGRSNSGSTMVLYQGEDKGLGDRVANYAHEIGQ